MIEMKEAGMISFIGITVSSTRGTVIDSVKAFLSIQLVVVLILEEL